MEEDVKNIKIKLKDMERHDVPSFPLDIVVFYLILYHTPNSTTLINIYHWASEASPTLGCSIEISRGMSVGMSVVCQINCVGGITCGLRACSKSFRGV